MGSELFAREDLQEMLESAQRIADGAERLSMLAETLLERSAPAAPPTNDGAGEATAATELLGSAAAPAAAAPVDASPSPARVEPIVWHLSLEAMDNYDAVQLVDLRRTHRADHHDPFGCVVCDVLTRRLGSLQP